MALQESDFEEAIRYWGGLYGKVVGIVGYCIVLRSTSERKYRIYALCMTDGAKIQDIKQEQLDSGYEGNVVHWATDFMRLHAERAKKEQKELRRKLRVMNAKAKAMEDGLEEVYRLTEMYGRREVTVFGRKEYL